MSWQGILGHDGVADQFRRCLAQGRLASTFLFVGPEGVGKRTFAIKLAQAMLCDRVPESELNACGVCPDCQQVISDSHPDLQLVRKPDDRAFIPVELFIGDRDHRSRAGLCHFMSLTANSGKRRIAIVDDADWLNQEGANSLLKTLEEPSPGSIIILISTSEQRQLPTIRSRSQVIRFRSLSRDDLATLLLQQKLTTDSKEANEWASFADGSLSQAIEFSRSEVGQFRQDLWAGLAEVTIHRSAMTKLVNNFIDSAGKDLAGKRKQLRLALEGAALFYRTVARTMVGLDNSVDVTLATHVNTQCAREQLSTEVAVAMAERCLDGIRQVNANANLGVLVDAWLCDLSMILRTGFIDASKN